MPKKGPDDEEGTCLEDLGTRPRAVSLDRADLIVEPPPSLERWQDRAVRYCKVAFRVTGSVYGFLLFWIGGWNLAAGWGKSELIKNTIYTAAGGGLLIAVDTFYSNASMDGNLFEWEPLYEKGCWVLPSRIALSCVGISFVWVGIYEILAIDVYCDSYDPTTYGKPGTVVKDVILTLVGWGCVIISRTYFISSFVPLHPGTSRCARYASPMRILPTDSKLRHLGATVLAFLGIFGQSSFWLGLNNLIENNSENTVSRELVYVGTGLVVYLLTGTMQARAYISISGVPVKGMEPMEFGPAACLVATASFFGQYIHLIGAWTLLDLHTFEQSVFREWCFFWGGIALMVVSGTIRAHSCVGFAPSPDETVFQSPRSTRPGEEPNCNKAEEFQPNELGEHSALGEEEGEWGEDEAELTRRGREET